MQSSMKSVTAFTPRVPAANSASTSQYKHLDQRLHSALKDLQKIKRYYRDPSSTSGATTRNIDADTTAGPEEREDNKGFIKDPSETLIKKLYDRNLLLERELSAVKQRQKQQGEGGDIEQYRQHISDLEKELLRRGEIGEKLREKIKQKDFIIRHLKAEVAQLTSKGERAERAGQELTKKSEMEHAEELRALEKKCASLSEQNTLLSSNLSAIVKSKAKKGIRAYVDTFEEQIGALERSHEEEWKYVTAKLERYEQENAKLYVQCQLLQRNAT